MLLLLPSRGLAQKCFISIFRMGTPGTAILKLNFNVPSRSSHCTRACDTLRVILTTFLPVIRENTDPWGACTIGVDVSREERVGKCMECKTWLLRIRTLPENAKIGTNLQQLQNMMVDL